MKKEALCKRAPFFSDLPLAISGLLPENSVLLFPFFRDPPSAFWLGLSSRLNPDGISL